MSYSIFLLPDSIALLNTLYCTPPGYYRPLFLLHLVAYLHYINSLTVTTPPLQISVSLYNEKELQITDLGTAIASQKIYFCLLRNICKARAFNTPPQLQLKEKYFFFLNFFFLLVGSKNSLGEKYSS